MNLFDGNSIFYLSFDFDVGCFNNFHFFFCLFGLKAMIVCENKTKKKNNKRRKFQFCVETIFN